MEAVTMLTSPVQRTRLKIHWWLPVLAVMAVLPVLFRLTAFSDYLTYVVVRMMILALYAMSFDIVYGYTGMFSLGHATFLGGGAYVVGILMRQLGLDIQDAFPALVAAMLFGLLMGCAMGFLASRLASSLAVLLVTFAIAETFGLLVLADPLHISNADNCIPGIPRDTLGWIIGIKSEVAFYYVVLVIMCLSYLALRAITRSSFGDTLVAIRENRQRASFLGYRVTHYQIAAFMVSGLFGSLAGALTAFHERSCSPEMFNFFVSGDAFIYTVLGGAGTLIGPLMGTAIMITAQEIIGDIFHNWLFFLGLIYIVLIMFMPGGLYPLLQKRFSTDQISCVQDSTPRS